MGQQLNRIEAKLARADEHLKVLHDAIEGFRERNPYRPFPDTDPDTGDNLVRVQIVERPPILDWGVLIGEALYHLRSALDHLAYILTGDPPPDETGSEFPIFWSRSAFRERGIPKLEGACDHAKAIIEDVQPYHRGDEHRAKRHPLWFLHELNNADKHRLVHLVGASVGSITWYGDLPSGMLDDEVFRLRTFTEDGAVIARWPPDPANPEMDMPFQFTFHIAFDEKGPGRGNRVALALPWLRDVVTDRVVARLVPFLD